MANKYQKYSRTAIQQNNNTTDSSTPFIPEDTLDFHDQGPLTEYDIQIQFEEFIENSYHANLNQLLIITGKGLNSAHGPVIKPLIVKLLRQNKFVKNHKPAGFDRGGEGAIEVTLNT